MKKGFTVCPSGVLTALTKVHAGKTQLVECCSAHYVTCFAQALHHFFIYHTEVKTTHKRLQNTTLGTG